MTRYFDKRAYAVDFETASAAIFFTALITTSRGERSQRSASNRIWSRVSFGKAASQRG